MPDTKSLRPDRTNIISALYLGTGDLPNWVVKLAPEYTTEGDATTFTTPPNRMGSVAFTAADMASLERASEGKSDPVFEGDDDL